MLTRAAHSIPFVLGANHLAVFKIFEGLATGESQLLSKYLFIFIALLNQLSLSEFAVIGRSEGMECAARVSRR
jgi:hypothetical protein